MKPKGKMTMVTKCSELEYYSMCDQPTTCGVCGSRSDFEIGKNYEQIHQCLNKECRYRFIVVSEAAELDDPDRTYVTSN